MKVNRFLSFSGLVAIIAAMLLLIGCDNKQNKDKQPIPVAKADFYIAPDGRDTNVGSADAPFASLVRARNAVWEKIAAGLDKDILVLIRGGTYQQSDTITFGPEDSGTEKHSITYAAYPGEKVVLSGGRKIVGWKKGPGELWTVELPDVKAQNWYFRQLFVNGKRAIRARTPNADAPAPWWIIKTSTLSEQEDKPFDVTVNGPVSSYENPGDVELICIYNNEGGRKRLESVNEENQTLTVAAPHKWNPKCFGNDWYLSAPTAGKACYLENAPEMLDQAGEWYLDRTTGILSYRPRSGENLKNAEVVAPVVQKTLLAVQGTAQREVVNLHFDGVHVEHVDWPLPAWGYNGLFCCNVAVFGGEQPGHRFIEAAVEFEYARSCNFVNGGIAHVGGMGLCLRDGTAYNIVEGNHIYDLGGGGIGAGGCNVAGKYLYAAPPPEEGWYKGYRIANNYVHHCGTEYYGATGIALYLSQNAVLAHNLVHDTAYFGICVAGSQDPDVPFAKNNTIEYNHIYNAMKVTVDGSGLYVTFANYDKGTLIRGNLIHDTQWNTLGRGEVASGIHDTISCHGLYLDSDNTGCRYENNVVYRNAGGPLLFNSQKNKNVWVDNLFQKDGTPPREFIDAMEACAGLEPAYRQSILKKEPNPCNFQPLLDPSTENSWAVYQYDLPKSEYGVVGIFQRTESAGDSLLVKLRDLDDSGRYELKGYAGTLAKADRSFFEGTFFGDCDQNLFTTYLAALDDLPILSDVVGLRLSEIGLTSVQDRTVMSGRELIELGLTVKPGKNSRVIWIVYQLVK